MIWAKEETFSRQEIQELQLFRLKKTVQRVYERCLLTEKKWMKLESGRNILKP